MPQPAAFLINSVSLVLTLSRPWSIEMTSFTDTFGPFKLYMSHWKPWKKEISATLFTNVCLKAELDPLNDFKDAAMQTCWGFMVIRQGKDYKCSQVFSLLSKTLVDFQIPLLWPETYYTVQMNQLWGHYSSLFLFYLVYSTPQMSPGPLDI